MSTPTLVVFNSWADTLNEVANASSDTFKAMLTNTAPSASSNTVKADITEISAGNGYSAGGVTLTLTSSSQTSGIYKLIFTCPTITASGGSIGPFRYLVIYDDTPTSPADPLVGYYDHGTSITLGDGDSFVSTLPASDGIYSINVT